MQTPVLGEGDADVEIVKAAGASPKFQTTTVIGEDSDLLILLLYHANHQMEFNLYFRSDKQGKNPNHTFDIIACIAVTAHPEYLG